MIETPVTIIRGGTSRGAFFRAEDLPDAEAARDAVLLRAFRGESGVLADGLGGEHPVLRKTAVIRPLARGADGRPVLDYLFGQVDAELASIDRTVECGNIASGVALFGRLCGWCAAEPVGEAWIHLANSGRRVLARWTEWTDRGGPIQLTFIDAAPATVGEALPTGEPAHVVRAGGTSVRISLVRGLNPYVFIDGAALGVSDPAGQGVSRELYALLDEVEAQARALWPAPATLKVCLVAAGDGPGVLSARIVYVGERRLHQSFAVTGAATLALASRIPGTVPYGGLRAGEAASGFTIRHPEGDLQIGWSLRSDGLPAEVSLERTCRLILRGTLY